MDLVENTKAVTDVVPLLFTQNNYKVMDDEKKYRVIPPQGTVMTKIELTESSLREFALSIIQDQDIGDVWMEKIMKDPIRDIISWLVQSSYKVVEL